MKEAVRKKKQAYVKCLGVRGDARWEEYKRERRRVKVVVREAKREADVRWSVNLIDKFREKSKMFWKEVRRVRGERVKVSEEIQDNSGELVRGEEVGRVWKDYFEKLLNVVEEVEEEGVEEEGVVGGIWGGLNEDRISKEEVVRAVRKLKGGKSAGLDGIQVSMLRAGKECMVEWLERLFNVCWRLGRVPQHWQDTCLVPIYKGKGEKKVCGNYRGISLMSMVGKVYGRILDERVKSLTKDSVGEEQGGFREGRGCVDQVFALRMLGEKCREKRKDLYVCFVDLEKAYDRVERGKI